MILGGWHNVAEVPASEPTTYNVTDLVHKKEYKFRIRAVNKIASSEPNVFGKPILAKDPWGQYLLIQILFIQVFTSLSHPSYNFAVFKQSRSFICSKLHIPM